MIGSFRDRATEVLFNGRNSKAARKVLPRSLWKLAASKLDQLDSVTGLDELRIPPGNYLEALKGDRAGQHSIRINDQYRICFEWADDGPELVEVTDYHRYVKKVAMVRTPTHRPPTHPGEMLLEEFLRPLGVTQRRLADAIQVPYQRVNEIVNGRRGVTPSTALRLARYLGTSVDFWLNLQQRWDLYRAMQEEKEDLRQIRPLERPDDQALAYG